MLKVLMDCIAKVMKEGKSESDAYTICIASTGLKPHKKDERKSTMEIFDWKDHDKHFDVTEQEKEKPGGSNVGKYKGVKVFCGPAGGAPESSYPVNSKKRAIAALAYANNAPNPEGITSCVYKHYPDMKSEESKPKEKSGKESLIDKAKKRIEKVKLSNPDFCDELDSFSDDNFLWVDEDGNRLFPYKDSEGEVQEEALKGATVVISGYEDHIPIEVLSKLDDLLNLHQLDRREILTKNASESFVNEAFGDFKGVLEGIGVKSYCKCYK